MPRRSPSLAVVGALLVASLAVFLAQEAAFAVHKQRLSHIPGPPGFPIVGHIPYLLSEPWMRFAAFSTRYGPLYKLWIWRKLFVVIADPVLVKRVFFDKRALYPKDAWSYKFFECVRVGPRRGFEPARWRTGSGRASRTAAGPLHRASTGTSSARAS